MNDGPSGAPERTARRTHGFTESVIRGMTRLAREHGASNLAQGFPDFPAPEVIKEAGARAIREDVNQYAITWGSPRLREAVAGHYRRHHDLSVDPDRELTVACGATEAMISALLAVVNPGDEVIVPEPFYENYGPDAALCGASPVYVPLGTGPAFDLDRLADAFSPRTRAVIINTPNNPTGRVLAPEVLAAIGEMCRRYGAYAITDEIYEHIVYEGEHRPMATLPGMREHTITVSGASKTFAITGWRIGWVVAPPDVTDAVRKVHDFLTVGAPAPLQEGVATALERLGPEYYRELRERYAARRDVLLRGLRSSGFRVRKPEGSYYLLADFSEISRRPDTGFARWLTTEVGVAPVPGSSFYSDPERGRSWVRFAFCKRRETLEEAVERLAAVKEEARKR